MNESHQFLVDHLGRHLGANITRPYDALGKGNPIFGFRGLSSSGTVNLRGAKDNPDSIYLISQNRVTVDLYLGNYYTSPGSAEKKRKEGKAGFHIHEHWPSLLREYGIDRGFPIRIRVWRSAADMETLIPDEVFTAYEGFPLTFMDGAMPTIPYAGVRLPLLLRDELYALAMSGEQYLCLQPSRSQDNILPNLALFRDELGVSTASGAHRLSIRRFELLNTLSEFGARALYVYRALRCLDRGEKAPAPPAGFAKDEENKWLSTRLKQARRWDSHDANECVEKDPVLADAISEIGGIASEESLTNVELEQAQLSAEALHNA